LYGEFQPQFLPPAHQIEWAEDASEFIDAAKQIDAAIAREQKP